MHDHATGPSGLPPNGHPPNGFPVDGFPTDGRAANGHARNGHATNGHATNGRAADGVHAGASALGTRVNGVVRPLPFTRSLAPADDADDGADDTPDLVAVQADDELINALGARPAVPSPHRRPFPVDGPPVRPGDRDLPGDDPAARTQDDRLVAMLAAWRAEIDADPIPELVDLDTAVAAVIAGVRAQESSGQVLAARRRRRAGRVRHLAPLTAAAAIVVATVGGVGLGSQDAVPGDTLWAVQKVVNPSRAESVEAKVDVENRLARVRTALRNGDTAAAAQELEAIRTRVPAIRAEEGLPLLVQEEEFLAAKLADTPPGNPADLSTPPRSNPAARSTGTPAAPTGTAPTGTPPPGSQPALPGVPAAPGTGPAPTGPGSAAVAPVPPVDPRSAPSAPDAAKPAPPVTVAPGGTAAEPPAAPAPAPAPAPGNSQGKVAPSVAPAPVDPPPPAESTATADTPAADTTAASGTAGADAATTATTATT